MRHNLCSELAALSNSFDDEKYPFWIYHWSQGIFQKSKNSTVFMIWSNEVLISFASPLRVSLLMMRLLFFLRCIFPKTTINYSFLQLVHFEDHFFNFSLRNSCKILTSSYFTKYLVYNNPRNIFKVIVENLINIIKDQTSK